jgi:hypothetical protein
MIAGAAAGGKPFLAGAALLRAHSAVLHTRAAPRGSRRFIKQP